MVIQGLGLDVDKRDEILSSCQLALEMKIYTYGGFAKIGKSK